MHAVLLLLLVYLNLKHCSKTFCGAMNVIAYDATSTQELDEIRAAVVALRTDLQQNRRTG
jgi:hypothetical protein